MNNGDPNLNSHGIGTERSPHWSNAGSANCLPIGTRLAEFEIAGVVGEGGFGNVYLAFDQSLQRTVAIKEYMPVALASRGADNCVLVQTKRHRETFETGMNSFINEARLLAQFDHPALIKVYRFWEQHNTAYMAMRYYEGQTFKNIINKHPELVTEAWLIPILKPILEALDVLYKIQILHRDISPDNIMIQTNGDAVLLDFGAARQIIGDTTQALTVILKPGYAPIEQYAEDSDMKQGPWTDIYALSAVVYAAIVKKPPPTSVTRLIKDPINLLQNSARTGFSKEFLAAIDKGMAVKPEDRPQSIAEFNRLLGIDKSASPQIIPLPALKSSSGQKKTPDATEKKQVDLREWRKSRAASAAENPAAGKASGNLMKKLSAKGSWALVVAGLVLAMGTGIYRLSPPDSGSRDKRAQATVNAAVPVSTTPDRPVSAIARSAATRTSVAAQSSTEEKSASHTKPVPLENKTDRKAATPIEKKVPATTSDPTPSLAKLTQSDDVAPKAMAIFRLMVKPWATVMVDGDAKGVSPPLKKLILPEGKHQIKFINPNFPDHAVDIMVSNKKKFGINDYDFSSQ